MVEISQLLKAAESHAMDEGAQPSAPILKWVDPFDESLRRAVAEFARQDAELLRSVREAALSSLHLPALTFAEEMARQQAEMLRPFSLFDNQMKDAINALSFKGAMQDAIADLGLGIGRSWAGTMQDTIAGLGLGIDFSWKSIIGDTVDAISITSPFPLPERRQVYLPEPDPEPPAEPQIDNATLLQTFFNRLRTGELTVDELRAVTQPGRTGPKDSDSEWTYDKIMLMWTGWQACKHKWTAARYLKEFGWGIQESRMYKLFREIGLSSKLDTN